MTDIHKTQLDVAVERLKTVMAKCQTENAWETALTMKKGQTLLIIGRERPLKREVRYEQI
jgi:hypothetical protein